jgi:hypothetical protein
MPTEIAQATTASSKFLVERVWHSVTSLSGRPLSRAGKETSLKAVVQATPNYVMSCFRVPVSTCDKRCGPLLQITGGASRMGTGKCIGVLGVGCLLRNP